MLQELILHLNNEIYIERLALFSFKDQNEPWGRRSRFNEVPSGMVPGKDGKMSNIAAAETETNNIPPLWTKEFILITISNLFLTFSFQMLIPTLPVYVSERGGDELAVGMVISVFTISALLTRPFAGKALDSVGRRKVLFIGLLSFILCTLGYYWMTTVFLILSLRFLHGIGWGISTTAYGTIVSDLTPQQRRGEGLGYYGLAANFAMALAPLVGIWAMNELGFGQVFLISVIIGTVGLVLSQFIHYPESQPKPQTNTVIAKSKEPFYKGLVEGKVLFPSLLVMIIAVTYGGIVSFITLFGQETGLANVGWFFLAYAGVLMITRPFAGKLFDRKGHAWVLLPGIVIMALGLMTLSFADSISILVVSALLYGAGFGAVQPSLQAWAINLVSANRRGAANGTFFSAFDLGIGLGAMILGMVANVSSYAIMYRFSVIMTVLFIIVYGWYLVKERGNKL